ncbi:hypothetical protein GCM10023339_00930 [Alloalcanivorax gelatiniphagus]
MSETPDLTPEQEAVRRLLADARHEGPPPADVVARLDDTLASLVAERRSSSLGDGAAAPAPVVDLGARRRRRAGIGVLAAAAVVVAGVAVGQLVPRGGDDLGSADSAASSQSDSPLEESDAPDDGGGEAGADSSELAPEALKSPAATPFAGLPTLSSGDAALDRELLELRPGATARSRDLGSVDALASCALPRLGPGRRLLARVDDERGVVVYRRPDATAQVADLYVCGTPEPVRTLVLPAP